MLMVSFVDGVGSIRNASSTGTSLPSTRAVSTLVHNLAQQADLSVRLSHVQMLWGQFIDHDISLTPMTSKVSSIKKGTPNL